MPSRPPFPPLELANRVCSLEGWGEPFAAYAALGAEAKAAIVAMLPDDWSFAGKRVLDFGCGAGRTLRHFLEEAQTGEVWGSDIDAASVEWLSTHLSPPLHIHRNEPDPPLGLPAHSFDLIWALSVFTHLTDNAIAWLVELHRLLAPGGLLIATYMGRLNGAVFTGEPWEEDRIGMNVLRLDQDWSAGGPMVLMSDWWIEAHWGRLFEILDSRPVHGQTWVLLRRREVELSVEEVAAPADDVREVLAFQHNLRQLQREHALALAALRGQYEQSVSWRLTRPLRAIRQRLRRSRGNLR